MSTPVRRHPSPVLDILPRQQSTSSTADEFLQLISDPFSTQVRINTDDHQKSPFADIMQIQSDAVLASVATSFAITIVIALIFCLLRPWNTVVYAPRLRHADEKHAPPPVGKGLFAWVIPVIKTKEQAVIEKVGLDAAIFLRFIKMCRNMFLVLSIIGCSILIPVNVVTGNLQTFKDDSFNVSGFMKVRLKQKHSSK
jgi:hypothetical protein